MNEQTLEVKRVAEESMKALIERNRQLRQTLLKGIDLALMDLDNDLPVQAKATLVATFEEYLSILDNTSDKAL